MSWEVRQGDCLELLRGMPEQSVQTCITSPPYWGLRDYGTAEWEGGDEGCDHIRETLHAGRESRPQGWNESGTFRNTSQPREIGFADTCGKCGATRIDSQLGLEPTPEQYVANMVEVFREVRRVLRADGTLWLNLGDSYANPGHYKGNPGDHGTIGRPRQADQETAETRYRKEFGGLKNKDLCGIPWRVAFALQADGWWLRSDIIWAKPNPMPESVTDRPTRSHEYLFLLTKSARYFYDAEAIREADGGAVATPYDKHAGEAALVGAMRDNHQAGLRNGFQPGNGRNKRSVWTVSYPDVEWIGKVGSCRRCGGLRVAGNGSEPTTAPATGASSATTESAALTGSHTSSSSDQLLMDSPSTTSVETPDASTPDTSKRSRCERTSSEATPSSPETPLRPTAPKGTPTTLETLMSALTASGSAVNVCECDGAGSSRSSVWNVTTQPFSEAHFATFPPKLIEPCVLAGSPPKCCGECGAPWVRKVEQGEDPLAVPLAERQPHGATQPGNATIKSGTFGNGRPTTSLGWHPTCDHEDDSGSATVLDPFCGSGTTGVVALRHDRSFVGLELNPAYCELARNRIRDDAPLLNTPAEVAA